MFSTWRECNDPFSAVSIWERIFNWPGWLPNSIWKSRGSCLLYIGYYRMSAATELEDSCFKIYAPTVGLRLAAFIFNHDVAESYAWTTNTSQVFVAVYCSSAREVEDKCLPSNLVASFPASLSLRMSRCHQRSLQWLDKKKDKDAELILCRFHWPQRKLRELSHAHSRSRCAHCAKSMAIFSLFIYIQYEPWHD